MMGTFFQGLVSGFTLGGIRTKCTCIDKDSFTPKECDCEQQLKKDNMKKKCNCGCGGFCCND